MTELDLVFRARRVITTAGEVARCVGVRDGSIVAIEPYDAGLDADRVVELGADEVLLPGLVDSHVHVNDPGRSEWEGFASATRAAAAGGVTTIIDMPLNSIPPTTDVAALEVKRKTATGQAFVDVGFWGGAVPGNLADLRGAARRGRFRLQVLPAALRGGRVPAPGAGRAAGRDARGALVRRADDRARRGLARDRPRTDRARRELPRLPRLPAARRGEPGDRAGDRAGPLDRLPGAHAAPVELGRAADDPVRPARRRTADRRDLPALPDLLRRGDRRRRDPVQVLPADPRGGEPRAALAGRRRRHHRLHRLRPLALHAGPEAVRHRRLRRRLGRHLVAAARVAGDLDARPGGAATR